MSQENVEIIKAWYDAYNREDWDAMLKDAAPGFEVDFSRAVGPWRGVFGLDQIRRAWGEFRDTWESAWLEPHEFIEAGDLVVVPGTQHVKGRGGIEVVARGAYVWTIRNGEIERMVMYQEREDALEAVGLSAAARVHDNVEIVRAMLEGTGPQTERDDWIEEFLDPEIEWHDTPNYPSAGVYVGREAFARHAAEYEDAWADWDIEIEELRAAGDRVVARIRYRGVGKQSGAPITGGLETPATGAVFELREGRILRVVQFVRYEEALEAVGLSEQDAHADS